MSKKKDVPVVEPEEQRADDQDAALETAFMEGTLPEEDRREPEGGEVVRDTMAAAVWNYLGIDTAEGFSTWYTSMREAAADYEAAIGKSCGVCATLDTAGTGTVLEKQLHGWKVKFMDGGTVNLSEGATISLALHRT